MYYLLRKKNTPKELDRKKDVLLRCLKFDPEDKTFRAIQESLNENGISISNDTLLDDDYVDFDYSELVTDLDKAPNYSDVVNSHFPSWAEYSRMYTFLQELQGLIKNKDETGRNDVVELLTKHADKLTRIFTEEDDMSPYAVMERLARRESIAICGIRELDMEFEGFSLGNLLAVGGYAGAGKTTLMCSMCYRNAIEKPELEQAYYSLEVSRDELYQWFVARHSEHPKWRSVPGSAKLSRKLLVKTSNLTPEEKDLVAEIALDLFESGNYGKIYLLTTKDFPSMEPSSFRSTLYDLCPKIQVLYFDHINKLENISFGGIQSPFERMNVYIDFLAEHLSKDFYGNMILTVVGVQINRTKFDLAVKNEASGLPPYSNNCWAGVNAVERSAYYALAVFSNYDLWRDGEIAIQSLKHRLGSTTEGALYVPVYPEKMIVGDDAFGETPKEDEDTDSYVDDILEDSEYFTIGEE